MNLAFAILLLIITGGLMVMISIGFAYTIKQALEESERNKSSNQLIDWFKDLD